MRSTAFQMTYITTAIAFAMILSVLPAFAAEEDPKASDPNMEELKIDLPDPSFSGTPLDYWSPNLEMSFKPRPKHYVPKGTGALVSLEVPVTAGDVTVVPKKLAMVTDGDRDFAAESLLTLKPGVQYVQLDLGKKHAIQAIVIWHFHEYERVYHDVIVKISDDPEFKEGVTELFNNDHDKSAGMGEGKDKEYVEKAEGKLIDAKGAEAQYVRLYSNGNSSDDANTYVEVDVYGKPAE